MDIKIFEEEHRKTLYFLMLSQEENKVKAGTINSVVIVKNC